MRDYTLIRSKRRSISIEISRNGDVIVRAPLHAPLFRINSFVSSRAPWIEKTVRKQLSRQNASPVVTRAQAEQLKKDAWRILPERLEYFAGIMRLPVPEMKVTSARGRFGSCNAKNRICFSKYLMVNDPQAVDYVVVHELAHIRNKNHGPAFWAEVASVFPDWKRRRKMLVMPEIEETSDT